MNLINLLKKYDCLKLNIFLLLLFSILFTSLELYRNKFIKSIWNKKSLYEKFLLISIILVHNFVIYTLFVSPILVLIYIYYNIYNYNKIEYNIYYIFYIILSLIAITSWLLYDNYCILTLKQNELLEINKEYKFRSGIYTLYDSYYLDNVYNRDKIISYGVTSTFIIIFTYLLIKK
mgnify:CR=1 FL=1